MTTSLPLAGEPPAERSDAARNRRLVLDVANALVASDGVDAVTMDAVAARAGVGKGTIFRRFGSREGLMTAVLDRSEAEWQQAVIAGPPPLGPGAGPLERLLAFGHSRLELNLRHEALIRAAGRPVARSHAAVSFSALHVRLLLRNLDVHGDLPLLATSLLAPLEVAILHQQTAEEQIPVPRIRAGWDDLVRRVVTAGPAHDDRTRRSGS